MARRPIIPQRKVIFVGCEGASEVGYAGLLSDLASEAGLHVHLATHDLGSAGDPPTRVALAIRRIDHLRKTRIAPSARFILIDRDQAALDPAGALRAQQLAAAHQIEIIWQDPCFEAVLLRHLPNCANRRPAATQAAHQALVQRWPDYEKPLTRLRLAQRISRDDVFQAAAVEPGLKSLLNCIGLLTEDDHA